jgi:hypothetical protein
MPAESPAGAPDLSPPFIYPGTYFWCGPRGEQVERTQWWVVTQPSMGRSGRRILGISVVAHMRPFSGAARDPPPWVVGTGRLARGVS